MANEGGRLLPRFNIPEATCHIATEKELRTQIENSGKNKPRGDNLCVVDEAATRQVPCVAG